jgi:hypothetical protein
MSLDIALSGTLPGAGQPSPVAVRPDPCGAVQLGSAAEDGEPPNVRWLELVAARAAALTATWMLRG